MGLNLPQKLDELKDEYNKTLETLLSECNNYYEKCFYICKFSTEIEDYYIELKCLNKILSWLLEERHTTILFKKMFSIISEDYANKFKFNKNFKYEWANENDEIELLQTEQLLKYIQAANVDDVIFDKNDIEYTKDDFEKDIRLICKLKATGFVYDW